MIFVFKSVPFLLHFDRALLGLLSIIFHNIFNYMYDNSFFDRALV